MSTFQPDLPAATTAVIKALEQDYTQPLHTLIEYVRMNTLEPARQQLLDLHLLREVYNYESYKRIMTFIVASAPLAVYTFRKVVDYSVLCVAMAYGRFMTLISFLLDSPERKNIAVNVTAMIILGYWSWRVMSLVIGYVFHPSTGLTSAERCSGKQPATLKKSSRRQQRRASRRSTKAQKSRRS